MRLSYYIDKLTPWIFLIFGCDFRDEYLVQNLGKRFVLGLGLWLELMIIQGIGRLNLGLRLGLGLTLGMHLLVVLLNNMYEDGYESLFWRVWWTLEMVMGLMIGRDLWLRQELCQGSGLILLVCVGLHLTATLGHVLTYNFRLSLCLEREQPKKKELPQDQLLEKREHQEILKGWVTKVLPEDWRGELEALRRTWKGQPKAWIEYKTSTYILDMLKAYVQIKVENAIFFKKSTVTRRDTDI